MNKYPLGHILGRSVYQEVGAWVGGKKCLWIDEILRHKDYYQFDVRSYIKIINRIV